MNEFLAWFSTPLAVATAWFFTVLSFFFGFLQRAERNKLKIKCGNLESNVVELKQQLISIQSNHAYGNSQCVEQSGENNINAGVVNGDFNFHQ